MLNKPKIQLKYNKNGCTKDFLQFMKELTYADYEEGQSDELEIFLNDDKHLFKNAWYPTKGDTLDCSISLDDKVLDCGTFTIDEPEFSGAPDGHSVTIKGLATGISIDVRTSKTKRYTGKTLKQIAQEMGKEKGLTVVGEDADIYVGEQVQARETDLAFLRRLSDQFGFIFKITGKTLVFTSVTSLNSTEPIMELGFEDIRNYTFKDSSNRKYKACTVTYYAPSSKKLLKYTAKSKEENTSEDVLKLNLKLPSLSEAKRIAESMLTKNKVVSASITLKLPNPEATAGVNIKITGFGKFDGIYHVKKSVHTVDNEGFYTTSVEIERISPLPSGEGAVADSATASQVRG